MTGSTRRQNRLGRLAPHGFRDVDARFASRDVTRECRHLAGWQPGCHNPHGGRPALDRSGAVIRENGRP